MVKNDTIKIVETTQKSNDFCFANNTTYGSGGIAKYAYFPETVNQTVAVFDYLNCENIRFIILGNGSNILASDKFYDGAVLCTKNLKGVRRTGRDTVFCYSGTMISSLLKYCSDNGLSGLEYLAGIPATIGGIVFMNGGAGGSTICDNVDSVSLYDGKMQKISNKSCNFGHKYSIMRDINSVILGAELKLTPKSDKIVRENITYFLEKRSLQPKGKSCGCVFKNAGNVSAGKIIDEAGLKGLTIGTAKVSEEHANFIINTGKSSADVYALIKEVKKRVFEISGIILEEEVVYIGDF